MTRHVFVFLLLFNKGATKHLKNVLLLILKHV